MEQQGQPDYRIWDATECTSLDPDEGDVDLDYREETGGLIGDFKCGGFPFIAFISPLLKPVFFTKTMANPVMAKMPLIMIRMRKTAKGQRCT